MIRTQPFTSIYLHSIASLSRSPVPGIKRFSEWPLVFASGNMLADCGNFERGPVDDAALRSKCSGSITGRVIVDS